MLLGELTDRRWRLTQLNQPKTFVCRDSLVLLLQHLRVDCFLLGLARMASLGIVSKVANQLRRVTSALMMRRVAK